jgi:hypothetical protein
VPAVPTRPVPVRRTAYGLRAGEAFEARHDSVGALRLRPGD